jgi:hypothetical protein
LCESDSHPIPFCTGSGTHWWITIMFWSVICFAWWVLIWRFF